SIPPAMPSPKSPCSLPARIWEAAETLSGEPALSATPAPGAAFAPLAGEASRPKAYVEWGKALAATLYGSRVVSLYTCGDLGQISQPGEAEGDFRARLSHLLRERRDEEIEELRKRYAPKVSALQERIRRAEQRISLEQSQYDAQKVQTAISAGAAILG